MPLMQLLLVSLSESVIGVDNFFFWAIISHVATKNYRKDTQLMDYRHQTFIFDMRDKLDELAYGAHNLAGACSERKEAEFFERLSRNLSTFGDREISKFHSLEEVLKLKRNIGGYSW